MITKENFVKYINELERLIDIETKISEASKGLSVFSIAFCEHKELIINLLTDCFDDEYKWIEFFIYDLKFGKKYKDGIIIDKNNKNISMKNAGELYDYIVSKEWIENCKNKKDCIYCRYLKPRAEDILEHLKDLNNYDFLCLINEVINVQIDKCNYYDT
jgi:hypothetical protein